LFRGTKGVLASVPLEFLEAVGDGSGGIIVIWRGDHQLHAQRISNDGEALWGESGVPLCNLGNDMYPYYVISDGSGGAILSWCDDLTGLTVCRAQRIDLEGELLWQEDGIPLASASSPEGIASDGAGGAIVVWKSSEGIPYADA
jgi:hypothetical protein